MLKTKNGTPVIECVELPQTWNAYDQAIVSLQDWVDHQTEYQTKFGYKLLLNPDFQRGTVWTDGQKVAYMEWLLRGGESGKDVWFNHPRWNDDYQADMVCVDGLQRMTTCLSFMRDEFKAHGHYASELKISYNVGLKIRVTKIETRVELLKWYIALNTGGTTHKPEDIARAQKLLDIELAK